MQNYRKMDVDLDFLISKTEATVEKEILPEMTSGKTLRGTRIKKEHILFLVLPDSGFRNKAGKIYCVEAHLHGRQLVSGCYSLCW